MSGFIKRHHVNTAIYLGASVLGKLASVVLIPLYTSRLTPAQYGSYGLALTLYSLLPPIVTLSLSSAMARFFFDYTDPERRDRAMGTLAASVIFLSLAAAVVGELVLDAAPPFHIGDLDRSMLRLVIWTCACVGISELPAIYFRARERAGVYSAILLTNMAITCATTAYLMLARNAGLMGMLTGILTGQATIAVFSIVFTFRVLRPQRDPELVRSAMRYSVPLIPHVLGNSLMVGIDRWALELYGFRDGLGLYTLATQLTLPISVATQAWNEASSPNFLARWRDGGDPAARAALPRIVAGFLACGGGALLAIILGFPILRFFVGARFQPAFHLVPWIGGTLIIGSLFSAFINVLFLRKQTKTIPVLTLSSVLVNAGLNVVLVPRFGVPGAIAATGIAYAFRSALMFTFAMRALRPSPATC